MICYSGSMAQYTHADGSPCYGCQICWLPLLEAMEIKDCAHPPTFIERVLAWLHERWDHDPRLPLSASWREALCYAFDRTVGFCPACGDR